LISRSTARCGLPCCSDSRCVRAVVTTPVEPLGARVVLFPSDASFPCNKARSASTSSFSRPAQRLLTLQPAHSPSHLVTLSTGGFSRVVTLPTAPIATGRNDPCREGLAPSQEPCLSTAHLIARSPWEPGLIAPIALRLVTARLGLSVGRPGPHAFTSVPGSFVGADNRAATRHVHRIPRSTSVTIAKRPSSERGTARHKHTF